MKIRIFNTLSLTVGLMLASVAWFWVESYSIPTETLSVEAIDKVNDEDDVPYNAVVTPPSHLLTQNTVNSTCLEVLNTSLANKEWANYINELLSRSMKTYQSTGLSESLIDLIAVKAGLGLSHGRAIRNGYRSSPKLPRYFYDEVIFSDDKSIKAVDMALASHSSLTIVNALENGQIKSNTIFTGEKRVMLLMELLIEKGLNVETIFQDLLDAGYTPHYTDLVAATLANFSVPLIQNMHIASGLSAEKVLSYYTTQRSLVNYAISAGNNSLVEYWWRAGSPPAPENLGYNAIDLLAKYNANYNDQQFNKLTIFLLEKDIIPNIPKTKQLILSRLSTELHEKYEKRLQYNPSHGFSENEQKIAAEKITKLHNESLNQLPLIYKISPDNACHYKWGVQAIQLAKELVRNEAKVQSAATRKGNAKEQNTSDIFAFAGVNEPKEIVEARLGKGQSIQAKSKIKQYRYQQVKSLAAEMRENVSHDENQEQIIVSLNEILQMAKDGRWDRAIALANAANVLDSTTLFSHLLTIAMIEKAEWNIMEKILENGAKLADNAVSILIIADNAELAQKLMEWDLNLHYKDPLGYDAVTSAVQLKSTKMFEFLLENGLYPDNTELGLDALDFAIKDLDMKMWKGYFIEGLLRVGIRIENSHYQWVEQKRHSDIGAYFYLLDKFPQLSPVG